MELAGWIVAAVFVAYRLGWSKGATRMAAAMAGRPTGWNAVKAWHRERRAKLAAPDASMPTPPPGFRMMRPEEVADMLAGRRDNGETAEEHARHASPGPGTGQYL